MMGAMCSAFHWTPAQFWKSTPHECMAVIEAHEEQHGDS